MKSLTTPRFLKASTAKALERAMLRNNLKRQSWHQYQIIFDGSSWYAWYYVDLSGTFNKEIEEVETQQNASVQGD